METISPIIINLKAREEELSKIKRYLHEITPVMFYRTNDLIHAKRVRSHLEQALPDILEIYGDDFDVNFARVACEVHDDPEIITGDVQLYEKERMSPEKLEELSIKEMHAIPLIIKKYGKTFEGHSYEELLKSTKNKDRLETQFVSFFDKFDGAGEAWHEIWAGNKFFGLPAGGKNGKSGGYIRRLNEFLIKYPKMKAFFEKFPEYIPQPFDFNKASQNKIPHTVESLKKDSGYFPYEKWKASVIKSEGTKNLTTQLEFL